VVTGIRSGLILGAACIRNALFFLLSWFRRQCFYLLGSRPWSYGYSDYKACWISRALSAQDFSLSITAPGHGWRIDERAVEIPWLQERLGSGSGLILDAGSALNYFEVLSSPILKNWKCVIATLAPEASCFWRRGISYVFCDLRSSFLRPGSFDAIACLSTIEHVGLDNTLLYTSDASKCEMDIDGHLPFLDKLHDLLRPGGSLFLTFPFGRRAVHRWFQVFDSDSVDVMIARFAPQDLSEEVFMYGPSGWARSDRKAARDALCYDPNTGMEPASDGCAFSRAVICLEMKR